MNKSRLLIIAILGAIVLLSIGKIATANMLATGGIDLDSMYTKIATLKKENMVMREKVYMKSSLTEVASEAATMGFVQEKTEAYVPASAPIALRQ